MDIMIRFGTFFLPRLARKLIFHLKNYKLSIEKKINIVHNNY